MTWTDAVVFVVVVIANVFMLLAIAARR